MQDARATSIFQGAGFFRIVCWMCNRNCYRCGNATAVVFDWALPAHDTIYGWCWLRILAHLAQNGSLDSSVTSASKTRLEIDTRSLAPLI